jgi:hypothetical protein
MILARRIDAARQTVNLASEPNAADGSILE